MNILNFFKLILLLNLIYSCCNKKEASELNLIDATRFSQDCYDVKLNYIVPNKNPLKGDFAHIFFEADFKEDFVEVYINRKLVFKDTISTDPTLGLAKEINLGKLSEIDNLIFSINKGRYITINNIEHNFIFVKYIRDNLIQVDFNNKHFGYY